MKQKPWSLIILAVLHILAPLGNLVMNAAQAGRSITVQWQYWMNVVPLPLLFVYLVLPVIAGVCIFLCRRWSYWVYLGCLALIFISNIFSFWTHMSLTALVFLVVILLADILAVAYFVVPSVQKVYLDPRLRWWEAAPRYHFNFGGIVNTQPCQIKVIGQGGMMVAGALDLKEGDLVNTTFEFDNEQVRTAGAVVFVGNNSGDSRYGIKFHHTRETTEAIRKVVDKLKDQGQVIKERLPGPEDRFTVWLKKFLTTGKGLFPSV